MVAVQADIQKHQDPVEGLRKLQWLVPTTEQGLQALVTRPSTDPQPTRWTQLFESVPKDPWQTHYIYISPGRKNPDGFDLYSAGPGSEAGHRRRRLGLRTSTGQRLFGSPQIVRLSADRLAESLVACC